MLHAPDTYMDKIAIGPGYARGVVDLDKSPADNVKALAAAKGVKPEEIVACVLDRPRHADIIASLRSVGARVNLITDGDVAGVINTTDPTTGIDIYLGTGGAPEGVLAAAALSCIGGQMQGRLVTDSEEAKQRARRMGFLDFRKKLDKTDMAKGDVLFAATGVTDGNLLSGVRFGRTGITTQTLVMRSSSGTVRWITALHQDPEKFES